ncbi:hypothetical protein AAGT95_09525 [Salinicola lusitanus]|uniref:DUF2570 domain-containing protein n=1 Tax=Salinicola lusitanus TaxID=1949085 RepID=A0ABZ3CYD4_9GAMM
MLSLLSRLGGLFKIVPPTLWVALATGALVIGCLLYQQHTIDGLRDDLVDAKQALITAERDRDAWLNVAFQRSRELATEREERAAGETATRELNNQLDTLDERYRPSAERIRQAPTADDAPVAPVLRQAIEDLP